MKARYLALLPLLALLSACSLTDGPSSYVDSIRQHDGSVVYRAQCHGLFEDSKTCYKAAKRVCGNAGYHVLSETSRVSGQQYQWNGDPRVLVFACGPEAVPPPPPVVPVTVVKVTRRIVLDANVLFAFNRSSIEDILPEGRTELAKLAEDLHSQYKTIDSVVVTGYTDRIGSDEYNLKLSRARADSVRAFLAAHGLDADVISSRGLGKADPVSKDCPAGDSPQVIACLTPDRRVVLDVTGERASGRQ